MELSSEKDARYDFELAERDGTVVVRLGGEIDLSNVDELRPRLDEAIALQPHRLVVDFSALTFFDSSGIALLVEVAKRVERTEIQHASALIRRIIEATGLSGTLRITG